MRKGCRFTLIEMLIVVAIITILAALLAPSLRRALDSARSVYCGNNLRQCFFQYQIYADNWRGFYPPICGDSFVTDNRRCDAKSDGVVNIQTQTSGETGKQPNWLCPVDIEPSHQLNHGDLRCVSYGENVFAWNAATTLKVKGGGNDHNVAPNLAMRPQNLPRHLGTASIVMLVERKAKYPHGYSYSSPDATYIFTDPNTGLVLGRTTALHDHLMYRHSDNTKIVLLHFDGHVKVGHYINIQQDLASMRYEHLWGTAR